MAKKGGPLSPALPKEMKHHRNGGMNTYKLGGNIHGSD